MLKKIWYVFLIIFGLLITGGAIISIDNQTSKNSLLTDLILMSFFGILPLVMGVRMLSLAAYKEKKQSINQNELALLRKAESQEGKITIAEAALASKVSVAEAKAILDKMQAQGIFEIALSEEGTLLYVICQTLDNDHQQNHRLV